MAIVLSQRGGAYWLGMGGLLVSTLAHAVGHAAPFWLLRSKDGAAGTPLLHIGLWFTCTDAGDCARLHYPSDEVYLHVTRGLQLGGLLALVVCLVMTCIANCRRQHPGHKVDVALIVFIMFTALLSVSGPLVYVSFTVEDVQQLPLFRYDWALAVSLASSGLALLSGCVLLTSVCCRSSPCAASSTENKPESVLDWQQELSSTDPNDYNDPHTTPEDFEQDAVYSDVRDVRLYSRLPSAYEQVGPYTVYRGRDPYTDDQDRNPYIDFPQRGTYSVTDLYHDPTHDNLDLACCGDDPRPAGRTPGAGPAALSAHNLYTAFPPRGEFKSKIYDAAEDSSSRPAHLRDTNPEAGEHLRRWLRHEGLGMASIESPVWRRRAEERWYFGNSGAGRLASPMDGVLGSPGAGESGPDGGLHCMSPFMFPRVLVKGFYEPGQGYPEYVIM